MRSLSFILSVTAVLTFMTVRGFSQSASSSADQKKDSSSVSVQGKFIDKNNNGICDNFESRKVNPRGANFVDKDGDGVCDHRQNVAPGAGKGNQNCRGKGYGYHHGQGKGNCCGQGYRHRHGCQDQK